MQQYISYRFQLDLTKNPSDLTFLTFNHNYGCQQTSLISEDVCCLALKLHALRLFDTSLRAAVYAKKTLIPQRPAVVCQLSQQPSGGQHVETNGFACCYSGYSNIPQPQHLQP